MNKTKIIIAIFLSMLSAGSALACEVCKKNQPEVLQDVSHGTGAQANLDYVILWSAVVIVTITLVLSLKFLIRPNESAKGHVKNIVIQNVYEG